MAGSPGIEKSGFAPFDNGQPENWKGEQLILHAAKGWVPCRAKKGRYITSEGRQANHKGSQAPELVEDSVSHTAESGATSVQQEREKRKEPSTADDDTGGVWIRASIGNVFSSPAGT